MTDPYYRTPQWRQLRAAAWARAKGWCEVPGCQALGKVVDHIISRKAGGRDELSNLRVLCRTHDNQIKEQANGTRRGGGHAVVHGCDEHGRPIDPSHWWNK